MTRAVWDLTSHNNTSQKNDRLWHRVVTKGSGDLGPREMVTNGNGDEGKWWRRECGDFRKRWRRECGDFGKWWRICGCRSHWNGCMNLACSVLRGGRRSTKRCVSPCRVAAAGDERYLVCAAVAAAVVLVPPLCSATSGCSCVRSSMRFLNRWLQIAVEWLHECCMGYVLGRKPEHETLCFSV